MSLCVTGLTADEHHISPIENLDNTINRLYSYLSGSDGEGEPDHPQDQRHHDQHRHHHHNHQHHHHQQPHQHHHHYHPGSVPAAGTVWDRPPSPRGSSQGSSSPCSSLSPSPCDSDVEHDRTVDTMDSGATGENHYSRIHDNCKYFTHPLTAWSTTFWNLNFHPLENVSRYRDPQLQVGKNYLFLYNLNQNKCHFFANLTHSFPANFISLKERKLARKMCIEFAKRLHLLAPAVTVGERRELWILPPFFFGLFFCL